MSKAVFCMAKSLVQAETIVDGLKNAGFSNNDISVLFPDKHGQRILRTNTIRRLRREQRLEREQEAWWVAPWVAGGHRRAGHSRSGPFHRCRSHHGCFERRSRRRSGSGVSGALIGLGMPEYEAKRFEGKIKAGNILVSVHSEDSEENQTRQRNIRALQRRSISTSGEASVPKSQASYMAGMGR